jgi:signal transduction histidine kinase
MLERWGWPLRRFAWIDLAWVAFAFLNLAGIYVFATWETVPFHFIWVSLTILYGFRVWRVGPTVGILAGIIGLTGTALALDIHRGMQPIDEITEVPLMSAMFLAMVWHAQRRLTATREIERVSESNLRLLERHRRFVQDASHELRTPIAVALGHAELVQRSRDVAVVQDAGVVVQELNRLRRLADRLLLLAAADDPDFLHRTPLDLEPVVVDALRRWSATPRRWRLGRLDDAVVSADADRLALAIDALIENAVKHTEPHDSIELALTSLDGDVIISVADSGPGISSADRERIFDRFAQGDLSPNQNRGGMGLGLAIVKTVAEAHGGSVAVQSVPGRGSHFMIRLRPRTGPGGDERYGLVEAEAAADPTPEADAEGVGVTEGAAPTTGLVSKPNQ